MLKSGCIKKWICYLYFIERQQAKDKTEPTKGKHMSNLNIEQQIEAIEAEINNINEQIENLQSQTWYFMLVTF